MDDAVAAALGITRRLQELQHLGPHLSSTGSTNSVEPPREVRQLPGHKHSSHANKIHVGPIHSPVAGRTDHLPAHVESGSYVIPADIISGMGEGNTINGFKQMRRIFGGIPYGQGSMPYGAKGGPYNEPLPTYAEGGFPHNPKFTPKGAPVPVVVAGGEYVLSPDQVAMVGDGDVDRGHRVLDKFVKAFRAKTIKTLTKLPPPRRD